MKKRVIAVLLCLGLLASMYWGTKMRGRISAQNLIGDVEEEPQETYVITSYQSVQDFGAAVFREVLKEEQQKQEEAEREEAEKEKAEKEEAEKEKAHKKTEDQRETDDPEKVETEDQETENQETEVEVPSWVNPVISPASLYLALAMTEAGAAGETRVELEQVLGEDTLHYADDLMERLPQDTETQQVVLSNSIWFDTGFMPKKVWLESVASKFEADAYCSDLAAKETQADINRWIDASTEGLIPHMLEESLPEGSAMALFNTVYFQAQWETPFQGGFTTERKFITTDGTKKKVPTMLAYEQDTDYFQDEHGEGIVLPYAESNYVFLAMKPAKGETVRDLVEELTPEEISYLLESRESTYLNLELPKFNFTYDKVYNELLEGMGLEQIFTPEADFSEMGTTESGNGLSVRLVQQKNTIQVDEEGTKAASATSVQMGETAVQKKEDPQKLLFNRPFLYLILDTETEVPLFVGIVDDPTAGVVEE